MGTNQNRADNYQINTFTKGMNSDTSYDMVGAEQYLFGLNIRITNNTLIAHEIKATTTEGIVTPVEAGKDVTVSLTSEKEYTKILATASIGNEGAIILANLNTWDVYRADYADNTITLTLIFSSGDTPEKDRFSVVINKEQLNLLKLYIADGKNPIILINLKQPIPESDGVDIDHLISGRLLPTKKLTIQKSSGRLKTLQLQYVYRLYKKNGSCSRLSLPTVKLQVIDPNRNKEAGNAEDTETSLGFQLKVSPDDEYYDRILIFRISYIKPNQQPSVYLIHDDSFSGEVSVLDEGYGELSLYSIDEFAALDTQIIIPQLIEQNLGYLFASNIKDQSLFLLSKEDETLVGRNSYEFVQCDVDVDPNDGILAGTGNIYNSLTSVCTISQYLTLCGIVGYGESITYNDTFGSSLLRSLRRGEEYDYGVVYYNKYGARSNVYKISGNSISTSSGLGNMEYSYSGPINTDSSKLTVHPLGIRFNILKPTDAVAYQIVRREKTDKYCNNILQVALSRPMRQGKYNDTNYRTPYYPNLYLSTLFFYDIPRLGFISGDASSNLWNGSGILLYGAYFDKNATNCENFCLYLAFSPEINICRNDTLSAIKRESSDIRPILYAFTYLSLSDITKNSIEIASSDVEDLDNAPIDWYDSSLILREIGYSDSGLAYRTPLNPSHTGFTYLSLKWRQARNKSNKSDNNIAIKLYSIYSLNGDSVNNYHINAAEDVKNALWNDGFTNVQTSGLAITSANKSYKQYTTHINNKTYVNWQANGMYDLATTSNDAATQAGNTGNDRAYVFHDSALDESDAVHGLLNGWIGPGPVCLLLDINEPSDGDFLKTHFTGSNAGFGTIVANIKHDRLNYNDSYTPYYGFGNSHIIQSGETNSYIVVFDGDIYITPAEFVNAFKTYDFNDRYATLLSGQVVYYIPLESRINTFFDYGMNYRNTSSTNLMLEPGQITGFASLERPLHLYNMIYSDNNFSNDLFTPHTDEDKNQQTEFPNRVCYSLIKNNGEYVDSWQIFKPADFIDTDARYGKITNIMTSNDTLYFWQERGFGKLSVNERSLVKDENSNTIQLGTGGVLQRTDYISTQYGMKDGDFSAISAEGGVYWIDRDNKAIVAHTGSSGAINYGELVNIQNIINNRLDGSKLPNIDYDILNYELLCNCLTEGAQAVFNLKMNAATALYTRTYSNTIRFNNVLFGLNITSGDITATQYNYLPTLGVDLLGVNIEYLYLSPVMLSFSVNSSASLTKVFDNQKIVFVSTFAEPNVSTVGSPYVVPGQIPAKLPLLFAFTTDYCHCEDNAEGVTPYTDRENNICYAIPRMDRTKEYGERLRGKWMKVDIASNEVNSSFAISHIITKFRQSYS